MTGRDNRDLNWLSVESIFGKEESKARMEPGRTGRGREARGSLEDKE